MIKTQANQQKLEQVCDVQEIPTIKFLKVHEWKAAGLELTEVAV